MNRIDACFAKLRAEGRAALVPFLTAGDPRPEETLGLLHQLVDAGADIIELGVPFSDPMADGPTIQLASERALAAGTTLLRVLDIVRQFRLSNQDTPLVLMGYLNPIEAMGASAFADAARDVGVDGVLCVDLAVEEADSLAPTLRAVGLAPIFLLAPNTADGRVSKMGEEGRGYLYYVSLKGVTGSAQLDIATVQARLEQLKQLTDLPIAVGFGIRTPAQAAAIAGIADAVVVGSALVEIVAEHVDDTQAMGQALHAATRSLAVAIAGARR